MVRLPSVDTWTGVKPEDVKIAINSASENDAAATLAFVPATSATHHSNTAPAL